MKEIIKTEFNNETASNYIREIRGQQVMLDSDLALMYGIPTFRLNEAVKRNIERFPEDFMFQLTFGEMRNLKSQFAISNRGGRRNPPFAFTEHGVTMLSSVISSPKAIEINIGIVRAFVAMRHYYSKPAEQRIEDIEKILMLHIDDTNMNLDKHSVAINEIIEALNALREPPKPERRPIGFRTGN